jgi:tetratricopeptide (TPR) repeat protein
MLRSALLTAVAGDGSTMIVRGPAGAGKSRLATEIVHDAAASGVDVHEGIASSTGSGAPFEPLRPLFRSLLAIDETGPISAHDLAAATDPSFATRLPLLGTLVGVSLPQTPLTASLDPGLRQELLAGVARDLIVAKARVRPRLLLLDDLHWADPATISLLVSLVPDMVSTPALMVLLARSQEGDPDPLARLGSSPGVGSIDLGALPPAELAVHAAHVASSIFGRPIAADDLRTTVVPRASGNPYFAEQILRLCAERDIDPTDEAAVAEAGLPETVQRLLLARLDLLPEDQQATLKVASVIGRRFAEPWVVGVEPTLGTAAAVHARLGRTEAAGMTTGVPSPQEPQHEFRHSLIHETTYGTIAAAIRRSLHGAVGRYIERRWAADLAPHAAALAMHFGRTEDRDRQRLYYRLAGDLAREAAAHETSIGHYERLLPLLDAAGRADVARLLGEELQQTGDWAAAERAYGAAIDASIRGERREARLRAEAALGYLHAHMGDPAHAAERLLATSWRAEALGSPDATRESLEFLVYACQQAGDLDGSLRAARRLASQAERTGDGVAECLAAQGEAVVHWLRGDYGVARASFERSLGIARETQYVRGSVHGANDFAGMLAEIGELENAFAQVVDGLEVARSVGYRHLEALLIGNAGELYRQHGDLEPAERCTLTAFAISGSMRDWPGIITRVGNMALILRERGDADPADRWATLALDLAVAVDDPVSVATFLHEHAAILSSLGRDREARERNEQAMVRAEALELRDVWLRAAILDVGFRLRAGELDQASALASLDALRSDDPVPTERAELAFASSLLAEGDDTRRREAEEALAAILPSMPNPTNRARFEIVTGRVPPEVPPLPALVMGDERIPTREEALALARELLEERRAG